MSNGSLFRINARMQRPETQRQAVAERLANVSAKPLGFVAALTFAARNYSKNNVTSMAQAQAADFIVPYSLTFEPLLTAWPELHVEDEDVIIAICA